MNKKKLVVIGGGAAGFFCAVNAARLNPLLEVVIIEKSSKLLSKVRISGGGRCNVTHSCFSIAEMIKKYPRGNSFLKKAFHHFFTTDTIAWFKERGVELKTEADGRMFPVSNTSETIVDCLMKEANKYGVEIMMNREVEVMVNGKWSMVNEGSAAGAGSPLSMVDGGNAEGKSNSITGNGPSASMVNGVNASGVHRQLSMVDERKTSNNSNATMDNGRSTIDLLHKWQLEFKDGSKMPTDFICIACGGYPKASQFDWLKKLGHTIESPVPSLFTFNMPGNDIIQLMGVSVENVSVKIAGTKLVTQGPLLVTHWGMSGPAILKLSAWGARELSNTNWHFSIIVNWFPEFNEQTLKEKLQQLRFDIAAKKIINGNPFPVPQRLWQYFLQQSGIKEDIRWADLPAKEQNKLIKNLCAQEFAVKGKTTFKEEFVTAGGIVLNEIDHNTMQSKVVPNLFFAGEVLDVDGITGGFNFQNAWTTGWITAKTISDL